MTTGCTRSCFRARQLNELKTGRILQRRLVQTALPEARTAGRGSRFGAHGSGHIFAYSQLVCTTGRRTFCEIRDLRVFASGNGTTLRLATQGKRAEVSAALFRRCAACKPARMSHKERPTFYRQELNKTMWEVPERYQNLSPVGSGAYGSVWYGICFFFLFLQSIYVEHCTTTERLSLPTEACRSYQKTDPFSICQKYQRKKTYIQRLLICSFTE